MLDVNLNGIDSHAVAEALTARFVPFIYSTGNGGRNEREGYRDRPVLKKPFQYEELIRLLTVILPRERPMKG
jgi:hypothetical protein